MLAVLLAAASGFALWNAFDHGLVLGGTAAGAVIGFAAGWEVARQWRRGAAGAILGLLTATGILIVGLAALTGDMSAFTMIPSTYVTFLSIGLPAAGIDGLVIVPASLVAATAFVTVWAAYRGRELVAVATAAVGVLGASLLAGPAGVPWWVAAGFVVTLAAFLVVASRLHYSDLQPLVGTSTVVRRNVKWWRPAFIALPATLLAAVAWFAPPGAPFDVRQFVQPDVVRVADDNPLAVAARLTDARVRDQPPDDAANGTDVTVRVDGPSPGRQRLAVLGGYTPEGWQQLDEFSVTGTHLAASPLFVTATNGQPTTEVEVIDGDATTGMRALPSAGTPIALADATSTRFSADAGIFLPSRPISGITYRTVPDRAFGADTPAVAPAGLDPALFACPDSSLLTYVDSALVQEGMTTQQRLDAIGSWLKLTRVYVPEGPGGQTIGSVEAFVGQDYARGNLEVFVTAFALLARCADVPVRVAVGYPAPPADATSSWSPDDLTAWVETPVAGVGWVAYDPLPTPQEQLRQAELAAADQPASAGPTPSERVATGEVLRVTPAPPGTPTDWRPVLLAVMGAVVALALVALVAAFVVRRRTIRRRGRIADASAASLLAWTTVAERLRDLGTLPGSHLTAGETARACAGRVPAPVTRMMSELAVIADRARYDGEGASTDDAGLAWALADECLDRLPTGWAVRTAPLRHPGRALARVRSTRGLARRRRRWTGVIPESAVVLDHSLTPTIAGFEIESRIGVGSTAAVFRAHRLDTGRVVALKVFAVDPGGRDFDHQRFVWEAHVAELVSGRPNLPEVLGSGFTEDGRPYLATQLYRHGTLRRRVEVGGPLDEGEVAAAGRQLAVALAALHENGILHGDVKPENVFVDDDDNLVLGDLGAAWVRTDGRGPSAITPAYAAPEVWLGHAPTTASDIYSLGLTLLFAATGRAPTPGSPPSEGDVVAAFGSTAAAALLEVDPRRRTRTALAAARRFGAEIDAHAVLGVPAAVNADLPD